MNLINQLLENLKKEGFFLRLKTIFWAQVFSKYAWVVPLSNKKRVTIVNAFQSILGSSKKQNKNKQTNLIWVDQGSEFYNSSFKNGQKTLT